MRRGAAAAAVAAGMAMAAGCGGSGPPSASVPDPPGPAAEGDRYFSATIGDVGVTVDFGAFDPTALRLSRGLRDGPRPTALAVVAVVNDGGRPRPVPALAARTGDGRTVPLVEARVVLAGLPRRAPAATAGAVAPLPETVPARGSLLAYLVAVDVTPQDVTGVTATTSTDVSELRPRRR